MIDKGLVFAKAAMAKLNTIKAEIKGTFETDRQKFLAAMADLGITFTGTSVNVNAVNDTLATNTSHVEITTGNPHGTTAADLGLGNVDNTSDADKPISSATQTALDGKQDTISGYTGSVTVVTDVNLLSKTVTYKSIHIVNGIITEVV